MLKVEQLFETACARATGTRQRPLLLVRQAICCVCVCTTDTHALGFRVQGARDAGGGSGFVERWVRCHEVNGLGAGRVGEVTWRKRTRGEAVGSVGAHGRSCRGWRVG